MPQLVRAAWLVAAFALPCAAQVHVFQHSCQTDGPYPVAHFAIVSPPATPLPVCRMTIAPSSAQCFPLQCVTPETWQCFPGDVTTFFEAGMAADACVEPGETQAGFQIGLFGNPCCLFVHFFAADGTYLGEQEYCFDCVTVGVERETWGRVKQLYE